MPAHAANYAHAMCSGGNSLDLSAISEGEVRSIDMIVEQNFYKMMWHVYIKITLLTKENKQRGAINIRDGQTIEDL